MHYQLICSPTPIIFYLYISLFWNNLYVFFGGHCNIHKIQTILFHLLKYSSSLTSCNRKFAHSAKTLLIASNSLSFYGGHIMDYNMACVLVICTIFYCVALKNDYLKNPYKKVYYCVYMNRQLWNQHG